MQKNIAEKQECIVCPNCSADYGEWEPIDVCLICKKSFSEGVEVFCGELIKDTGQHFCSNECKQKFEKLIKSDGVAYSD